jgi:hypothetical protein
MPHCLSPENCLPLIWRLRRHPRSCESQNERYIPLLRLVMFYQILNNLNRPHNMSICSSLSARTSSHESQSHLKRYAFLSTHVHRLDLCESTRPRVSKQPITTIHDLDNDSLLNVFYLFRPNFFDQDGFGWHLWELLGEHWWYKLAQVCQRWRYLILGSPSHLRLRLICTAGTPVEDMLLNSPPFPLVIYYDLRIQDLSAEDEEGMLIALGHRDRVQCIYLCLPVASLQKFIPTTDYEFPALEYVSIGLPTRPDICLTLAPTFEAPRLRKFDSRHFVSPIL